MRNLTLKHLRLLESAARLGSFTAAAEANHITPPAVTMQMRQLEQEVGLPLFDRDARGLTPTAAGHELLLAARRIEGVLTECREALAALQDLGAGKVTVGVVSTAKYFAPRIGGDFRRSSSSWWSAIGATSWPSSRPGSSTSASWADHRRPATSRASASARIPMG